MESSSPKCGIEIVSSLATSIFPLSDESGSDNGSTEADEDIEPDKDGGGNGDAVGDGDGGGGDVNKCTAAGSAAAFSTRTTGRVTRSPAGRIGGRNALISFVNDAVTAEAAEAAGAVATCSIYRDAHSVQYKRGGENEQIELLCLSWCQSGKNV